MASDTKKNIKKLVTIGDAQVGKSSLLYRFTYERQPNVVSATIGAAYFAKNSTNNKFRINMWDTAGQERFRSMVPMYVKDANIIVFVYDITDIKSFQHLKDYWVEFAIKHISANKEKPIDTNPFSNCKLHAAAHTIQKGIDNSKPIPISSIDRKLSSLNSSLNNNSKSQSVQNISRSISNLVYNDDDDEDSTNPFSELSKSQPRTNDAITKQNTNMNMNMKMNRSDSRSNVNNDIKCTCSVASPVVNDKNNVDFVIVANKCDLDKYRAVPNEYGIELATKIGGAFIEISALNGNNTAKLWEVINNFCNNVEMNDEKDGKIILNEATFVQKVVETTSSKCNGLC